MNQEIPLIPFIDFITLVALMSFSAWVRWVAAAGHHHAHALNATDLEEAPVITIDKRVITVAGNRVADTSTLLSTPSSSASSR